MHTKEQIQDITERKQTEAALQESERRFRAISDQTFQFMWLLKLDGTLLEANQTALNFGRLQPTDVVGYPFWQAGWWTISQETQTQLKSAITQCAEGIAQAAKGEFVRYEVDIISASGIMRTIDFSLKPLLNETGKIILLISEGRDISEREAALLFERLCQRDRKLALLALRCWEDEFRAFSLKLNC